MEIKITTTEAQEAALTELAAAASITSEEYLQLRVAEVLESYVADTKRIKTEAVAQKFDRLAEADKAEVIALIDGKVPAEAVLAFDDQQLTK